MVDSDFWMVKTWSLYKWGCEENQESVIRMVQLITWFGYEVKQEEVWYVILFFIIFKLDANFLKVVSSAIVDKYIGESARLIREMFNYARDHQPCIIFMDEIDAIGGRRFSEGTSADREIQRTLMELLNQMDGFDVLGQVLHRGIQFTVGIRCVWYSNGEYVSDSQMVC